MEVLHCFQLEAIKQGLSELTPGQFLTLHGMPGSGKSVLAAESVRDKKIYKGESKSDRTIQAVITFENTPY